MLRMQAGESCLLPAGSLGPPVALLHFGRRFLDFGAAFWAFSSTLLAFARSLMVGFPLLWLFLFLFFGLSS
jgi:hypothetical protein